MATLVYVITTGKRAVGIIASMQLSSMEEVGHGTDATGRLGDHIVTVTTTTNHVNKSGRSFEKIVNFM